MIPYLYPAPFHLDARICNVSPADKLYEGNHDKHDLQKSHYFCPHLGYRIHFLMTLFIN
jgi:hypothetical protein